MAPNTSILNSLTDDEKGISSYGKTEKALLYIYLVDLFDEIDDDKDLAKENKEVSKLESALMKRASKKLKAPAMGRTNGAQTNRDDGDIEIDREFNNFVKFHVQYNPATIRMRTMNGKQEKKIRDDGMDNVRSFDTTGKTKLSFDLIFDDVDTEDAFGPNDMFNINKAGGGTTTGGGQEYSVRKRMNAIVSLLSSVATQQVVFYWARMCFRGQLTDVSNKFTMFNKKGNPIRGEMHIELTQDAGQKHQFGYDEKYWTEAFNRCFKKS